MKLWASLRDHPKWVPLSLELRGAWTTLALIACAAQPSRGEIASRAHAVALLTREAPDADSDALVEGLIAAGLIDELHGGRLGLHDFDSWQQPPSHTRDGERERKRAYREDKRVASPKGSVGTESRVSQGKKERPLEERSSLRDGDAVGAPLEEERVESDLNALFPDDGAAADLMALLDYQDRVVADFQRGRPWARYAAVRLLEEASSAGHEMSKVRRALEGRPT
jgi:hypothetical protein